MPVMMRKHVPIVPCCYGARAREEHSNLIGQKSALWTNNLHNHKVQIIAHPLSHVAIATQQGKSKSRIIVGNTILWTYYAMVGCRVFINDKKKLLKMIPVVFQY